MRLVTKGLNRNERLIIILYYYEELTMKEIGATLDLSESRVSQMHSSIVQTITRDNSYDADRNSVTLPEVAAIVKTCSPVAERVRLHGQKPFMHEEDQLAFRQSSSIYCDNYPGAEHVPRRPTLRQFFQIDLKLVLKIRGIPPAL